MHPPFGTCVDKLYLPAIFEHCSSIHSSKHDVAQLALLFSHAADTDALRNAFDLDQGSTAHYSFQNGQIQKD